MGWDGMIIIGLGLLRAPSVLIRKHHKALRDMKVPLEWYFTLFWCKVQNMVLILTQKHETGSFQVYSCPNYNILLEALIMS